jgi:hypothetical protein
LRVVHQHWHHSGEGGESREPSFARAPHRQNAILPSTSSIIFSGFIFVRYHPPIRRSFSPFLALQMPSPPIEPKWVAANQP